MGLFGKSNNDGINLSEQETDLLLRVISTCKFEGKDVFLLHAIVNKLSDQS